MRHLKDESYAYVTFNTTTVCLFVYIDIIITETMSIKDLQIYYFNNNVIEKQYRKEKELQ